MDTKVKSEQATVCEDVERFYRLFCEWRYKLEEGVKTGRVDGKWQPLEHIAEAQAMVTLNFHTARKRLGYSDDHLDAIKDDVEREFKRKTRVRS